MEHWGKKKNRSVFSLHLPVHFPTIPVFLFSSFPIIPIFPSFHSFYSCIPLFPLLRWLRRIDKLIHQDQVLFRGPEGGPEIGLGLRGRVFYPIDLPGCLS